jgi:hypothetical protein
MIYFYIALKLFLSQALIIGDEAKQHNRLLDDLDSNVDIATAALQVNLQPFLVLLLDLVP